MAAQRTEEKVAQLLRANDAFVLCYYCMRPFSNEKGFLGHIDSSCVAPQKHAPDSDRQYRLKFRDIIIEKSKKFTKELQVQFKDSADFRLQPREPSTERGKRALRKDYCELKKRKQPPSPSPVKTPTSTCHHVCPFCDKSFRSIKLFYRHGVGCKGIRKLEPHRACSNCDKEMPVTKSYIHEVRCSKKFQRYNGRVKCPKCPFYSFNFNSLTDLIDHLANECLPQVKRYLTTGKVSEAPPDSITEIHVSPSRKKIKMESNPDNVKVKVEPITLPNEKGDCSEEFAGTGSDNISPKDDVKPELPDQLENIDMRVDEPEFISDLVEIKKENDSMNDLPSASTVNVAVEGQKIKEEVVSCPFCLKTFASLAELKSRHLIRCNGIKVFEPELECPHCSLKLPRSLHAMHGIICQQNSCRFVLSPDNLKYCDVFCPECHDVCKAKDLPEHLTTCLKHLSKILIKAMANSDTCDWNQTDAAEDFILKAGLKGWLE